MEISCARPNPCRGCKRRTAECHPVCPDYAEFAKECERIRKNRFHDKLTVTYAAERMIHGKKIKSLRQQIKERNS
jgi:hypothetical protein